MEDIADLFERVDVGTLGGGHALSRGVESSRARQAG